MKRMRGPSRTRPRLGARPCRSMARVHLRLGTTVPSVSGYTDETILHGVRRRDRRRPSAFLVYPPTMSISVRPATPADRETCVRLLVARLVEHDLPADSVGIGSGVDLAFIPHSPAWLLLAEVDGVAVGVVLANQIVSVEKYGYTLWVEEFNVVPEARRRGVATAFLDTSSGKVGAGVYARSSSRSYPPRPPRSPSIEDTVFAKCAGSG